MVKKLEEIAAATVLGVGAATLVAAGIVVTAAASSALGAIGGEILDHVPYLKRAIPEGIRYLANYINPEAAEKAKVALQGNLDKLGAAMGFIGGFYRASLKCKKD